MQISLLKVSRVGTIMMAPLLHQASGLIQSLTIQNGLLVRYGEDGIITELSYGADEEAKHPTAFFRLKFEGKTSEEFLGINPRVDEGAIFYLNGTRIGSVRIRQDDEAIYHGKKLQGADPRESDYVFVSFQRDLLKEGENLLAVSVHQADGGSGDLFLDA